MAGITLEKGKIIYDYDRPMTALHLITEGRIAVFYPGGRYYLGKGDVIGICEICSEVHFLKYIAEESTTILTYSFPNMVTLDDLLRRHPDVARLFLLSAFRQINILLERSSVSEPNCCGLYQKLQEDCEKYNLICRRYRIAPRSLEHPEDLSAYLADEHPDLWLTDYYIGLRRLLSGENYKYIVQDPALSSGFLQKCSLDFRKTYSTLDEQCRYIQQVMDFYFNESGNDLFDFYTSLCYKLGPDCDEAKDLYAAIDRMIACLNADTFLKPERFSRRADAFRRNLDQMKEHAQKSADTGTDAAALGELAGSLDTILEFSGADPEMAVSFRRHVTSYSSLEDKQATDEEVRRLRMELTKEFYLLYSLIFRRTLNTPDIPVPVRMFLYFGYADEQLAGVSNAVYLRELAESITDHSDQGVYTFYHWLLAIFNGRKEPSRNEFDQDYTEYIHKLKVSRDITEAEEQALSNDSMAKVEYELRNMFPNVNKITYGRLATFCPLFTADNVLKKPEDTFVTVSMIAKALEQIKRVDYTLFYRESLDMDHLDILGKELMHFEYLPDIILMPNAGIRGVMWQEIEGKRRNSSSRMLLSIFHMEDPLLTIIRMAGEFRWEMCKRVQGGHWNDVSDPSLTSEYFDYIQFYRKNHELSPDAKEKVRSSLQRSKNSFKEMFVKDYITWIMFEGNGSPRLNKVARRILFTYCPFPKDTCEILRQNPQYAELLHYRDIKTAQRLHLLNGLIRKLSNNGIPIPESLEREKAYAEGTITQ